MQNSNEYSQHKFHEEIRKKKYLDMPPYLELHVCLNPCYAEKIKGSIFLKIDNFLAKKNLIN